MPSAKPHLHTFYIDESPADGVAHLSAEESRHALQVVRRRPGDRVRLLDGRGNMFDGEIAEASGDEVRVNIVDTCYRPKPVPGLWVAQALPKGRKMTSVLRWAVELEMEGVFLLLSAKSVPRVSEGKLMERAEKILVSELKVSSNPWMPEVKGPGGIEELLEFSSGFSLRLLAWEESENPLFQVLGSGVKEIESVIYAVGPEGGFSNEEVSILVKGGFRDVSLGKTRMRTETAQAYLGSILRYSLQGANETQG